MSPCSCNNQISPSRNELGVRKCKTIILNQFIYTALQYLANLALSAFLACSSIFFTAESKSDHERRPGVRERRPPGDLPGGLPAAAAAGAPDDGAVGRATIRIVTRCWPGARAGAGGAAADDDAPALPPPSRVARFRTCWRRAARLGMESSPPGPPAPDRGPDEDERRASPPIPAVPDEPPDDEEERRVAVVADDERCRCCLRAAAAAALIPAMISDGLPSMGLPGLLTSLSMLCRLPAREDGERRRASADALPAVGGDAPLPCLLRDAGVSLARGLALGSEGRAAAMESSK